MMKEFYYCQDWGTFLDVPNILLSYGVVLYPNDRIKKYNLDHADKIFLDCGAYSLRNKFTKYPIDRYIEWILTFGSNLTHVATVDIIGDVENTVKAGVECIRSDCSIPWVPVLQGVTVSDYSKCARLYEKEGIDLSDRLVAVGGLKQKKPSYIRYVLDSLKAFKTHAFGLTLFNLRDPIIWNSIFSTDSGTWKNRPNSVIEKYKNLEQFKSDLEKLRIDYNAQSKIEGY